MERIIRIDDQALEDALKLTPQERLRQANAAFRLYYSLHHPYDTPKIGEPSPSYQLENNSKENRLSL